MKQVFRVFWGCTLAAALALTGCGRGGAPGSSGAGSMSGSGSGAMSGGTAGQGQQRDQQEVQPFQPQQAVNRRGLVRQHGGGEGERGVLLRAPHEPHLAQKEAAHIRTFLQR